MRNTREKRYVILEHIKRNKKLFDKSVTIYTAYLVSNYESEKERLRSYDFFEPIYPGVISPSFRRRISCTYKIARCNSRGGYVKYHQDFKVSEKIKNYCCKTYYLPTERVSLTRHNLCRYTDKVILRMFEIHRRSEVWTITIQLN